MQRAMSFHLTWIVPMVAAACSPILYVMIHPQPSNRALRLMIFAVPNSLMVVWLFWLFRSARRAKALGRAARHADWYACLECGFPIGQGVEVAVCPECGRPYRPDAARLAWRAVGAGWWNPR
jgi:hypothetical protein